MQRAEELLDAVVSTPMTLLDGGLLVLSISIGVAHLPQHSAATAAASTRLPMRRSTRRNGPAAAGCGRRELNGGGCSGERAGSASLVPHSSGWRNGRRASLRC